MNLITLPDIPALKSDFRPIYIIAAGASVFTGSEQTYDWGGAIWEGEVAFDVGGYDSLNYGELAQMKAFIMACKGKTNGFLYGDAEYLVRGPRGTDSGTSLVKGASQTGASLIVDGFTPSETGVVMAGDYLQLGSGLNARLYGILADADSDGSGEATILLDRPLRTVPNDNDAVTITGAKGLMKLTENNIGWSANPTAITRIVIPFKEVI